MKPGAAKKAAPGAAALAKPAPGAAASGAAASAAQASAAQARRPRRRRPRRRCPARRSALRRRAPGAARADAARLRQPVAVDHGGAPRAPRRAATSRTRPTSKAGAERAHLAGLPDCLALLVPRRGAALRDAVRPRDVAEDLVPGPRRASPLELLHRAGDDDAASTRSQRVAAAHRPAHRRRRRRADARALAQAAAGRAHRHAPGHAGGRSAAWRSSPTPSAPALARAAGGAVRGRVAGSTRWRSPARCSFSLDELRYEYPQEIVPAGDTPASLPAHAHRGGLRGATRRRFPGRACRPRCARTIEHELALIAQLKYEPYFLTVADIVHWARAQGILCQGRGSAANSAVCYCLGVTEVDPARMSAAVRALHQRRAQRAARHRRRLRAPAPRGGHPVHLPQVRPPPRRAHRRGHQLPAALGAARRRPGAGHRPASASTRWPRASTGSTAAASRPSGCARTASTPTRRSCRLWVELTHAADRLPAPPVQHPGGFVIAQRPDRAAGAGGKRRDGRTAPSSSGTRTTSTRSACSRSTSWRWACSARSGARSTSSAPSSARTTFEMQDMPGRRRGHLRHDLPRPTPWACSRSRAARR